MHKVTNNILYAYGGATASLGAETSDTVTTGWKDMAKYRKFICYAPITGGASGDVTSLQIWQGSTSAGGGSKTIASALDSKTFAATTDTDVIYVEVDVSQIDIANGFQWLAGKLSSSKTDSTVKGGILIQQANARYAAVTQP